MGKLLYCFFVLAVIIGCSIEETPLTEEGWPLLAPPLTAELSVVNACGAYDFDSSFTGESLTISLAEVSQEEGKTKDLSNLKVFLPCIKHVRRIIIPKYVSYQIDGSKIEFTFKDKFESGDMVIIFDNIYPATDIDVSFKAARCEEFFNIPGPDLCGHDQGRGE